MINEVMIGGAVAGSTYRGRLLLGMEMTDAPAGGGGLGAAGCAAATEVISKAIIICWFNDVRGV